MAREGIDYAWHGPIDVDAFREDGVTFVIRYVSNNDDKNLHRAEADLLSNAGFDLALVWESSARRPLSDRAGGIVDAHKGSAQATECGMPPDRPIYFAVDYDAPTRDLPVIARYLEGAASVLGGVERVGVYGGYPVVKYCFDHERCAFGWQTRAWSGTPPRKDPRAHIYQHPGAVEIGGIDCDRDTAYAEDFGQWRSTEPADHPPFPYPRTHYLATARPDPQCHWGASEVDRANVAKWQEKMGQRGWILPATGTFGRQSDRVCRRFQQEKGLTVDGKVGPITWDATWTAPVT